MFPCDKLLLLLLCCWWVIYIITAGRVSHAHAAPFELVKCGAFGQRHLTDARMRELCIEQAHMQRGGTNRQRERETDRPTDKETDNLPLLLHNYAELWQTRRQCGMQRAHWTSAEISTGCGSVTATVDATQSLPACLPAAKCQMQHSIGSRQHRHQWQAAFAMMQLLIRNSPAGLACLLRALHTEKKQFVTHTHTQTKTILHLVEIQG